MPQDVSLVPAYAAPEALFKDIATFFQEVRVCLVKCFGMHKYQLLQVAAAEAELRARAERKARQERRLALSVGNTANARA